MSAFCLEGGWGPVLLYTFGVILELGHVSFCDVVVVRILIRVFFNALSQLEAWSRLRRRCGRRPQETLLQFSSSLLVSFSSSLSFVLSSSLLRLLFFCSWPIRFFVSALVRFFVCSWSVLLRFCSLFGSCLLLLFSSSLVLFLSSNPRNVHPVPFAKTGLGFGDPLVGAHQDCFVIFEMICEIFKVFVRLCCG